jgi:hypothetical protein
LGSGSAPTVVAGALGTLAALLAPAALGHAFGARYDLPLPLALFLAGAGSVVALSFVGFALLPVGAASAVVRLQRPLSPPGRVGAALVGLSRLAAAGLLGLVLLAGALGPPSVTGNLAPVLVWVIGWVGLAFVQSLIGDLWAVINPWATLHRSAARLLGRDGEHGLLGYPARLGLWPAACLFLVFAWLELVSETAQQPRILAGLLVAYSVLTWAGMILFGCSRWLANGDAISVAFGLLARFAPLAPGPRGTWTLRPWGLGLLDTAPPPPGRTFFVLCLLAAVSFDGFSETAAWTTVLDAVATSEILRPSLLALQDRGIDLLALVQTLGLLGAVLAFAAVYLAFAAAMAVMAGTGPGPRACARGFILALVPIAIAYHLAHYLSYLLIAGQLAIPALSDPLGRGWDLLGTARYTVDISVVTARFVWYSALVAIVVGHVASILIAHLSALEIYPDRRTALRSQVPMVVLMVGYTMTSLWILAQPVVTL